MIDANCNSNIQSMKYLDKNHYIITAAEATYTNADLSPIGH